ncbi:hypothetical protein RHMOL_Rhmol03G0054700 [Rhododendron molle]|uniref:Uncharacterized protein n=1 Tax=Rhododendron molle TaxID=49168 RepID=A0ACC0PAI2_RHOML|nr:hypothetical protein RHMOL_Rhmol03G0054700 [Rhododendron molle]
MGQLGETQRELAKEQVGVEVEASEGIWPVRKFDRRLRTRRWVSFPIVLAGMGPTSPMPGSRREITKERVASHSTPAHVQAEAEVFHRMRLAGWEERKERRDCHERAPSQLDESVPATPKPNTYKG